jgi:hypothetical protein
MNGSQTDIISGLPGADHIREGLRDYHEKRHTIPSCLVRMARHRLQRAGMIASSDNHDLDAELDLYQLLSHEGNRAHSRYNSLIRELVSFEHALDHRLKQGVRSQKSEVSPRV